MRGLPSSALVVIGAVVLAGCYAPAVPVASDLEKRPGGPSDNPWPGNESIFNMMRLSWDAFPPTPGRFYVGAFDRAEFAEDRFAVDWENQSVRLSEARDLYAIKRFFVIDAAQGGDAADGAPSAMLFATNGSDFPTTLATKTHMLSSVSRVRVSLGVGNDRNMTVILPDGRIVPVGQGSIAITLDEGEHFVAEIAPDEVRPWSERFVLAFVGNWSKTNVTVGQNTPL